MVFGLRFDAQDGEAAVLGYCIAAVCCGAGVGCVALYSGTLSFLLPLLFFSLQLLFFFFLFWGEGGCLCIVLFAEDRTLTV